MSEFIVEYGHGPRERTVATVEEFDQVWQDAQADARSRGVGYWMIVYTKAELSGPTVAVGVGRDFSWLRTDNGDAPGTLDTGDTTLWVYGNQSGSIPPGREIPNQTAQQLVRYFIDTNGGLPGDIAWIRP